MHVCVCVCVSVEALWCQPHPPYAGGDVFLFTSYQQGTDAAGQDGRCGDQHIVYQLSYVRDSVTDHRCRAFIGCQGNRYHFAYCLHCIAVFDWQFLSTCLVTTPLPLLVSKNQLPADVLSHLCRGWWVSYSRG